MKKTNDLRKWNPHAMTLAERKLAIRDMLWQAYVDFGEKHHFIKTPKGRALRSQVLSAFHRSYVRTLTRDQIEDLADSLRGAGMRRHATILEELNNPETTIPEDFLPVNEMDDVEKELK